jgi:hypothetical protein
MDAKSSPTSREIRGGDLSNRSGNCHLFIIDAALCIPDLGQLEPGGVAVLPCRALRSRKIVHSRCLPMRREDSYEHPHSLPAWRSRRFIVETNHCRGWSRRIDRPCRPCSPARPSRMPWPTSGVCLRRWEEVHRIRNERCISAGSTSDYWGPFSHRW